MFFHRTYDCTQQTLDIKMSHSRSTTSITRMVGYRAYEIWHFNTLTFDINNMTSNIWILDRQICQSNVLPLDGKHSMILCSATENIPIEIRFLDKTSHSLDILKSWQENFILTERLFIWTITESTERVHYVYLPIKYNAISHGCRNDRYINENQCFPYFPSKHRSLVLVKTASIRRFE